MSFLRWMTGYTPETSKPKTNRGDSLYTKAYNTFEAYMYWNPVRDWEALEIIYEHPFGGFTPHILDDALMWDETGIEEVIIDFYEELAAWRESTYYDDEEDEWLYEEETPSIPTPLRALVAFLYERGPREYLAADTDEDIEELTETLRTVGVIR